MNGNGLVRQIAGLGWAYMHQKRRALVRPTDRPVVRTDDGAPVRFLLLGNGLMHGWGVASHHLAPTGEIARGFRTLTSRTCEIDFVGDAVMHVETVADWLGERADHTFSGAVVSIGGNDAYRLTPVAVWERHLTGLLDLIAAGLPAGAPILVVGISDVYVPRRVQQLHRLAVRHAHRLDRASAAIAEQHPTARFVPVPSLAAMVGRPAEDVYAAFAVPIAVALAEAWQDVAVDAEAPGAADERFDRDDVRAVVEASRWDELPELKALVAKAQARFGVSESSITLLDGDRTWHVASNGAMPNAAPGALSYCRTVVETDEPLVVANAKQDERFADNPYLQLVHAPFYAGVPLHAADGTTIGSFCLLHGFARAEDKVDLEALRGFAAEAELLLHDVAERAERAEVADEVVAG